MPFQRIDLLTNFDVDEARAAMIRWVGHDNIKDKLLQFIAAQDRDYVEKQFEAGELGFLKNLRDMRGLALTGRSYIFPRSDSFEMADLSYTKFRRCGFISANFTGTEFIFAQFIEVVFQGCVFDDAHFYGTTLEQCSFVDCDFVGGNGFLNCDFTEVYFVNCFFNKSKFVDCRFDENVNFLSSTRRRLSRVLLKSRSSEEKLERKNVSGIYRSIKESYLAGQISLQARDYFFLQRKALTRYNQMGALPKLRGYAWELLAGYGTKPTRVLFCLAALIVIVTARFAWVLGGHGHLRDAFLLSSGAFLTFGAKTDLLATMSRFDNLLYSASAFVGISLVALLVTVVANLLLKDN